MNIFIYRRTHINDPCKCGIFGICDCMGSHRDWNYDAVIGVGSEKPWERSKSIRKKLTWIGIYPHRDISPIGKKTCSNTKKKFRGSLIRFKSFHLMNEKGLELEKCAPNLGCYMFRDGRIPRAALSKNLPEKIRQEVVGLVLKYENCPPSKDKCQCKQS